MRSRKQWSPAKVFEEMMLFVNNPKQRAYLEAGSFSRIERYINEGEDPLKVSSCAGNLALWYSEEGVTRLMAGDASGVDLIHLGASARTVELDVQARYRALVAANKRIGIGRVEWSVFPFATFLAAGALEDAEVSFQLQMRYLHEGLFYDPYYALFPRFTLELYAAWKGQPVSLKEFGFRPMQAYGELLALWDTEDMPALNDAIVGACELHVSRSRDSTDKERFDFDQRYTRIFPAEILSLLRLRELKGLANPLVDHPLMRLPTAKLYPVRDTPWHPVLLAGYQWACAEIEERSKSVIED